MTKGSTIALWAIVALLGVNTVVLVRTLCAVEERFPLQENGASPFVREADRLLDEALVDELYELALQRTHDNPLDTYGYWYLGRAQFLRKEWSNATESLTISTDLDPRFGRSAIPYIQNAQAMTKKDTEQESAVADKLRSTD